MAPKKSEKEAEPSKAQKAAERLINYDHEMFLQAFESEYFVIKMALNGNKVSKMLNNA